MKLLIRNLSRTTSEQALLKLFEEYGKVQSCHLILDKESGESKGFGFVEMPKQGEAKAATKALNGKEMDGNKIRVKKAESKALEKTSDNVVKKDELTSKKKTKAGDTGKFIWKNKVNKNQN